MRYSIVFVFLDHLKAFQPNFPRSLGFQTVNLPSALFIYSYFVVIFCQTTDNNRKIMNKEKERTKNDGNGGEEA